MSLRWTEEEFRDWLRKRQGAEDKPPEPAAPEPPTPKRRSKYGNTLVEIDGKKFGSKKEARYYFNVLLPQLAAGEIKLILRQVAFDLPGGIRYVADFCVLDKEGNFIVIDTKSEATKKNRVYINKKKQMDACWGIQIQEE